MGFRTIAATGTALYGIDENGTVWQYAHNAALGWHWTELETKMVPRNQLGQLSVGPPPGWPPNVPYPPVTQTAIPPMGAPPPYPAAGGAPPAAGGKASCHAPPSAPAAVNPLVPSGAAVPVAVDRNAPAVPPPGGDVTKMGVQPPR